MHDQKTLGAFRGLILCCRPSEQKHNSMMALPDFEAPRRRERRRKCYAAIAKSLCILSVCINGSVRIYQYRHHALGLPVDISYVPMSRSGDPHFGAFDEYGKPGYVANEALHQQHQTRQHSTGQTLDPKDLMVACSTPQDENNIMLEHIQVANRNEQKTTASVNGRSDTPIKLFCFAYKQKGSLHDAESFRAVTQTWGSKCDGFLVASNITTTVTTSDSSKSYEYSTVAIQHKGGKNQYYAGWQKLRSYLAYIYDHYYEKYDWFFLGYDQTYLIVENLRQYVESDEIRMAAAGKDASSKQTPPQDQVPLYLGRRFALMGNLSETYVSGEAGITLNKAALKVLVVQGLSSRRYADVVTYASDIIMARILRECCGVLPYDTRDATGAERFMPFQPKSHYNYRIPRDGTHDWYAQYSINLKEGLQACSEESVTFHYVFPPLMYRIHALLYDLCPH